MPSPDSVPATEQKGGGTCWQVRTHVDIDPDPDVVAPTTLAEARAHLEPLRLMQPEHIHRLVRVQGDGTWMEQPDVEGEEGRPGPPGPNP